jgi:hypothetical protein
MGREREMHEGERYAGGMERCRDAVEVDERGR